jgi:hypothetical protein
MGCWPDRGGRSSRTRRRSAWGSCRCPPCRPHAASWIVRRVSCRSSGASAGPGSVQRRYERAGRTGSRATQVLSGAPGTLRSPRGRTSRSPSARTAWRCLRFRAECPPRRSRSRGSQQGSLARLPLCACGRRSSQGGHGNFDVAGPDPSLSGGARPDRKKAVLRIRLDDNRLRLGIEQGQVFAQRQGSRTKDDLLLDERRPGESNRALRNRENGTRNSSGPTATVHGSFAIKLAPSLVNDAVWFRMLGALWGLVNRKAGFVRVSELIQLAGGRGFLALAERTGEGRPRIPCQFAGLAQELQFNARLWTDAVVPELIPNGSCSILASRASERDRPSRSVIRSETGPMRLPQEPRDPARVRRWRSLDSPTPRGLRASLRAQSS